GGELWRRGGRGTGGGGVGEGGGGNVAAGADAVLDDDRLAEPLLKFGSHCAHHDVDAAAGRESDDEGDRSGRELLSEAAASEREEARQRGRHQDGTTCDHCSFPSDAGKSIRTIRGRAGRSVKPDLVLRGAGRLLCRAALKGRGFIGRLSYRPRLVRVLLVFLLGAARLACLRRRRQ